MIPFLFVIAIAQQGSWRAVLACGHISWVISLNPLICRRADICEVTRDPDETYPASLCADTLFYIVEQTNPHRSAP